ncbi:ABC transporter ATP-binding protein [Muricomes intestini]|jgi:ABC-2 type transport system ATP-binding protein|uniref:ABC transporter ATP-binding protein n=1 Tax=Muricomes intestini TaxID=1796634 RepID=UPI002FDFA4E6
MKITFESIAKQYKGKYALKDFSTELGEGVYGLLGTNGAGKTTLLNIFVGILKSDAGRVRIDGVDVRKMGVNFLARIGYLPQSTQFYKDFRVMEFLNYMCALKDIPKSRGEKRVRELLEIVNLSDAQNKKIGALSGGMRQRVGIAQAMLNDPDILILDEPTAGLDPQERIRFRNLITKFSHGRTVLLATHIVSDIEFIANEVMLLKGGHLLMQDTPQNLTNGMKNKVWSVTVTDETLNDRLDTLNDKPDALNDKHDTLKDRLGSLKISNMLRDHDGIHLRIIDDEKPDETAVPVQANLEDVFLYHFGEGEQW